MTANLANYIFNKETLYRNFAIEAKTVEVEKIVAEKPKAVQEKTTPISSVKLPNILLKSRVLILTDAISDNEKNFLSKILNAIGTNLEQVDLIELSKVQSIDYQDFIAQNVTQKFISFGVGLGKLDWNILLNLYQIKNVAGVDFLLSDELRIIEADIQLKKTLWGELKKMFEN